MTSAEQAVHIPVEGGIPLTMTYTVVPIKSDRHSTANVAPLFTPVPFNGFAVASDSGLTFKTLVDHFDRLNIELFDV